MILLLGFLWVGRAQAEPDAQERGERAALEARVAELERLLSRGEAQELPSASAQGGLRVEVGERVRHAVAIGGPVEVGGLVRGTAVGLGGDVRVEPGGQVEGDAVALGGEVQIEEGAQVSGRTLALSPLGSALSLLGLPGEGGLGALWTSLARRLALLLVFVAAGTVASSLWPRQIEEIGRRLSERPFWYGIVGATLSAGLGLGALVFALTIIGLPLSLLFLFVLGLAWLLGTVAACRSVGRAVARRGPVPEERAWLLGAGVFVLLAMLPGLGSVVALLIGLPAAGAAVVAGLDPQPRPRSW